MCEQNSAEREAFEAWHRKKFATRWHCGGPTRDMHNGARDERYGPVHQQEMWEHWQRGDIKGAEAIARQVLAGEFDSKDAEIAQLREEIALLKAQAINDAEANTGIRAERDALRAQIDAAQKQEPLEYRWFRKNPPAFVPHMGTGYWEHMTVEDFKDWGSYCNQVMPLYAAPVPATDADRRDAERLDWLDRQVESYGFEGIHEGNRWVIDGPYRDIRQAIDEAMATREVAE